MDSDILVFAGKQVGGACLEYLLQINAPVKKLIVSTRLDNPILNLGQTNGIETEIYSPQTQQNLLDERRTYGWLLNLWSPHILHGSVLALATHRLNIHPSLVPHCQGNDNAAWAIRKGLPAGVSLLEMSGSIDAGDVYIQQEIPYQFPISGKELQALLQQEAIALFRASWLQIFSKVIKPQPQTGPVSYHTRKMTELDRVQNSSASMTLANFLQWGLAHDFSPGTTAEVCHQGKIYKLVLTVEEKK